MEFFAESIAASMAGKASSPLTSGCTRLPGVSGCATMRPTTRASISRLFGHESLEVADSLRNLSIILGDKGNWTETEAMAREVLAMRRKLFAVPKHQWIASALDDVA